MEVFAASACPDLLGRKELTGCVVTGCRFGGARRGLCVRHQGFWERAGQAGPPGLAGIPARRRPMTSTRSARCRSAPCGRRGTRRSASTTSPAGSSWAAPRSSEFIVLCESNGDDRFDFRPLAGRRQLKLELQYALQCRHDERQVNTASGTVRRTIALAAASGVASLLDWPMPALGRVLRRQPQRQARAERAAGVPALRPRSRRGSAGRQRVGGRVSAATSGSCGGWGSRAASGCGSTASPSRGSGTWLNGSPAGG